MWRCGGFHYWGNTTDCYLFLVLCNIASYLQFFLAKFHFLLLKTHVYLFQFSKKIDADGKISQWEMFCKKGVLFCHVSMLRTLAELFCTKKLFSLETDFLQDYFTRYKKGRNSFRSCAINKFRIGTICRILNYSAEHLKVPGIYR